MKKDPSPDQAAEAKSALLKRLWPALPMMLLTFMILSRGKMPRDFVGAFALFATFVFFNLLFILMLKTGRTDRYRAVLFVTYAVAFVIAFISHLLEARGSMALSAAEMIEGRAPFCHIVIPVTLIPAVLKKTIIYPGTIVGGFASVTSMLVIWIGASLSLGRGFCGWACFFGGLEEGFSRILKRPLLRRINPVWTYLPYAVLLAVVLAGLVSLSPVYCEWLCPFKTVTEFAQITSLKVLIQTVIFLSLFTGLVVVLPILTRKRTQCGLFCPFGAFQSLTNKVSPFDIRIDPARCTRCGRCAAVCPTFSMDPASPETGKPRISCMKCGRCIDACPKGAISYHVRGTLAGAIGTARLLFLFPAFLFLATMAGGNITVAIVRIIRLALTGSMI